MVMSNVWKLETPSEEAAINDLKVIIDRAFTFQGVKERAYLRKLWDNEPWANIKLKLMAEGSTWYVWFMDGVRQHINSTNQ